MTRPQSGWNPTRRNRNIGTSKSGHGRDGELVIPESWHDDRVFSERLCDPVLVRRTVAGHDVAFLVEPTRPRFIHPCTVEDVCRVLELLPSEHVSALALVIFRQSTRKQRSLSPAWGRLQYCTGVGGFSGPAVILEAQDVTRPWRKSLRMNPEATRELERLLHDGHEIVRSRRDFQVRMTPQSARATALFRTLLHEIGHYVDWLRHVVWPCPDVEVSEERREQLYFSRSHTVREDFAHRYATETFNRLEQEGKLPFEQLSSALSDYGLQAHWFHPDAATTSSSLTAQ